MKKYKVIIEGANFLVRVGTETRKLGFFTTRFVEAQDEQEAENKTIDMLRVELETLVQNDKSDSPMMFVEEIDELKSFGEFEVPGAGFTWYRDEGKAIRHNKRPLLIVRWARWQIAKPSISEPFRR